MISQRQTFRGDQRVSAATRRRRRCYLRRVLHPARGFTLFEVLLVLTIMTLLLGLAWPSISRLYAHHHLRQAADLLSVRLSAGRIRAIESGLVYQFRYEPGGRRFLLVPFDRENIDESAKDAQRARRVVGRLPSTCQFEGGGLNWDKGVEIPDDWLTGLPEAADYADAKWSSPVLFHPDGTATNFELTVLGDKKSHVKLTLRALTGGVVVSSGKEA